MKSSRAVATSYAKAIFALAKERGETDRIGTELDKLVELVLQTPTFADYLSRPWIAPAAKRAVALEVAQRAEVSSLARDFFALVVARGRADHLHAIAAAYRDLVDADLGRVRARVRTAVSLGEEERRALAGRLGRELDGKSVVVEEVVDATLLGGFVAEVGSLVLDGSLDGQLARLRARLAKA